MLNAANEVAVAAFLDRRIRFDQIHQVNVATLEAVTASKPESLEDLLDLDARSREAAGRAIAPAGATEPKRYRMLTIVAFIVALGLLIAVHEYGHYRVAVACGVKVLRFSVGFGKTLYRWQPRQQKPGQSTEFVIGAFPLGGYVKMLDEREGPVAPEERHLAFNTQPLKSRAAIVAAGPVANLLLAVLLYAAVNWYGVEEPKPILASPVPGSRGRTGGPARRRAWCEQAGFEGEALQPVRSFEDLRWLLTRGALDGRDVRLQLARARRRGRQAVLALSQIQSRGCRRPAVPQDRHHGSLDPAGDRRGDGGRRRRTRRLAQGRRGAGRRARQPVVDGQQLRELIRAGVKAGQAVRETWRVRREGQVLELPVQAGRRAGRRPSPLAASAPMSARRPNSSPCATARSKACGRAS